MYRPTVFQEDNLDKLVEFMRANSFATLVSMEGNIPVASHIPMVITVQEGVVKLTGHLAKPNPQWRSFGPTESLAIFTGAHGYVSPTLYEAHESVPTWNYIAVHAYGVPQIITLKESKDAMDTMIHDMIDTYEASYHAHWHGLSPQFREGMMNGIVGFEMPISKLEGKYKLSQNRSQIDQKAVSESFLESADSAARAAGQEMRKNLEDSDREF